MSVIQTKSGNNFVEITCSEINDRIALIMPAHNEVDAIEDTVREIYSKIVTKMSNVTIWVFEDGSTDGTKQVLEKLGNELNSFRAKMTKGKKGYPKAMRDAFLSINPDEYDYIVAMDSDGQYDPDDFFKLWQVMQRDSPDIVMGRRKTRREPPYRKLLSQGLNRLEKLMFPVRCKDVTSVMRLMRTEVAQHIAKEVSYSKFNFWLEFTARMALNSYKIVELPIDYRSRVGGSKVYSVAKMPKVIISELGALRAVRKEYHQRLKQVRKLNIGTR
jgi:dolichol-phosphate mannosyltransferase